jgi:DNA-binding NarL/FixJ family response regulator
MCLQRVLQLTSRTPRGYQYRRESGLDGVCGTVLVVDDDAAFRGFVSELLTHAGFTPLEAASGAEALAAVKREQPALVLLDIELPDLSGYEICHELKREYGERLSVILLSGIRTEAPDRAAGLLVGADDYVVKPFEPGELTARVRRCIVRAAVIEESANGPRGANPFGLTPRELEVLRLLGEGLDTATIAQQLVISPKTVATHAQRVLSKLGAHSRVEAVVIAHRAQLIDVDARAAVDVA